jgi:hypothetical protein
MICNIPMLSNILDVDFSKLIYYIVNDTVKTAVCLLKKKRAVSTNCIENCFLRAEIFLFHNNLNFDHITVHNNLHSAWDPNFEY